LSYSPLCYRGRGQGTSVHNNRVSSGRCFATLFSAARATPSLAIREAPAVALRCLIATLAVESDRHRQRHDQVVIMWPRTPLATGPRQWSCQACGRGRTARLEGEPPGQLAACSHVARQPERPSPAIYSGGRLPHSESPAGLLRDTLDAKPDAHTFPRIDDDE